MKRIILGISMILLILTLGACEKIDDTLRIGMDLRWPPFETIDVNGAPTGISVDLAYELGEYLNRDVEIIDLDFGTLITSLETGDIDIILASMSITEDRALKINFTEPYFYFPLITVLNKDFAEEYNIETKADLYNLSGVTFIGPKTFVSLTIPAAEADNPILVESDDASGSILEVSNGTADAFIISASSAVEFHNQYSNTTVILWDTITSSPIGMGVRKSDTELLAQLNEFIAGLEENGVYDRLAILYDDIIAEGLPGQGLEIYTSED